MSGNGEVIKSFLVGLGFDVDESSLAAFNKGIQGAALRVTALYGAVNAFAGSMLYAFSKISESFEELGYQYHIIAPAINKAIVLRQELLKAYSSAGINIRKVIVDSIKLNMSLAKTKFAMEAIYKSVGSKFFGLLQKQSDTFRKKLYENMPYIINALTHLVGGVFKAFEAVTRLGGRVWDILSKVLDFFIYLDKATDGWSTVILGVIAAWKLLNLSFLATPLGAIIAIGVALLGLYDDYKTFKEGGTSLFDWGPVVPIIENIESILSGIVKLVKDLASGAEFHSILDDVEAIGRAFMNIDTAIDNIVRKLGGGVIGKILDFRDSIDQKVSGFFGGSNNNSFLGGGAPLANTQPLGSNSSNNTSNSTIANMQTSINISGSPNADATGRATAAQQTGVNRDFIRNLKGSTR